MTSSSQRDKDGPKYYTANPPHFFKIILSDSIRDGKLEIPKKFIRKYGNGLSSPVLLKVPSGTVWQIELTKCDGEVWLQNGWQEFAKYYFLAHGDLIVFRYEGNSNFNTIIFDMSASEIDYPLNRTAVKEPNCAAALLVPKIDKSKTTTSVQILDNILPCRKMREKAPLPHLPPHKLRRTAPRSDIDCTSNVRKLVKSKRFVGEFNFSAKEVEGMSSAKKCSQTEANRRMVRLTEDEKRRALEKASAFKSENPFVMIVMQPSYVHSSKCLGIPLSFGKICFTKNHGYIILRVSDGRTWSVKYNFNVYNKGPRAELNSGWKAFVQDNNLEVGDVCVFELIQGPETSLKVVTFRAAEDTNCHMTAGEFKQLTHKESATAKASQRLSYPDPGAHEAAAAFESGYPFFKVVMSPCYIQYRSLTVRQYQEALSRDISNREYKVTLLADNKSWSVKLLVYPDCSYKLSGGMA